MKTIRIADFGSVTTGKTPSSNNPEHFGQDYPFITPTDMDAGRVVQTERGISKEGYLKFHRQILPKSSICFVCIGATIGKICMTTERSLTNQQINSVVVDTARHDPFFVYYLLSTYAEVVKSVAGGAATPIVNKTTFENLEVSVPPLNTQRKIAAILSAYDDLIENNLRRIKILEEMAQTTYREWFVKFRFPGYQKVKMVDSPLGKIPEGWEVLPINKLGGEVVLGGTPARNNPLYWVNGTIPWLKSGKMNELRVMDGTEFITDTGLRESATKMMPPKTVLIAITGAILISFLEIDACANQSVVGIFSTKKCSPEYLHLYLCENISLLKSKMSGSAQQHINKLIVEDIPVLIPSSGISSQFVKFVEPQYEIVVNLLKRNSTLRQTRDLLLPKLISGEVDVSELEISIPEAIQ